MDKANGSVPVNGGTDIFTTEFLHGLTSTWESYSWNFLNGSVSNAYRNFIINELLDIYDLYCGQFKFVVKDETLQRNLNNGRIFSLMFLTGKCGLARVKKSDSDEYDYQLGYICVETRNTWGNPTKLTWYARWEDYNNRKKDGYKAQYSTIEWDDTKTEKNVIIFRTDKDYIPFWFKSVFKIDRLAQDLDAYKVENSKCTLSMILYNRQLDNIDDLNDYNKTMDKFLQGIDPKNFPDNCDRDKKIALVQGVISAFNSYNDGSLSLNNNQNLHKISQTIFGTKEQSPFSEKNHFKLDNGDGLKVKNLLDCYYRNKSELHNLLGFSTNKLTKKERKISSEVPNENYECEVIFNSRWQLLQNTCEEIKKEWKLDLQIIESVTIDEDDDSEKQTYEKDKSNKVGEQNEEK